MQNRSHVEEGGVHIINPDAPNVVQGQPEVIGYAYGAKTVPPDDPACLAKESRDRATKTTRYWLKRATNGINAGKLFNPNWPIQDSKAEYAFVKSTEGSFQSYLRFLETNNPMFLLQAERT